MHVYNVFTLTATEPITPFNQVSYVNTILKLYSKEKRRGGEGKDYVWLGGIETLPGDVTFELNLHNIITINLGSLFFFFFFCS